jgi:peptidyl-prolyl cis-trans isomerase C
MYFFRLLVLTAALMLAGGCRLSHDTAAEVDGRRIEASELESAVRAFTATFGQLPPAFERELPRVRRGVLERLIDRELMLAEAGRRGIRPAPEELERTLAPTREGMPAKELEATLAEAETDRASWRRAAERDLTIEKLQVTITAPVTVSDQELDAWIARHRDRRELPEEVRAAQLLVRTEAAAVEARRRILGGMAFAEVAREISLSPDADRGGDLGFFARGQMPPEFDEVVFPLPRGQLSEVVASPYGFHLFLVTDRRPARTRSDAELRADVKTALLAGKREEAFRAWLTDARAKASIKYNRSLVPGQDRQL